MRNKIKQLLKKEDGFTLVELLGVIVILGIILAIAIPSIGKVIEGAREDTRLAQIELVHDAAELYSLQTTKTIAVDDIKVNDLIDEYIKKDDLLKAGFNEDDLTKKVGVLYEEVTNPAN